VTSASSSRVSESTEDLRTFGAIARLSPFVLFVGLVALVYADPLFVRRNFVGRDLIAYNLPTEKVIHDAYAEGSLPLWMPYVSGGRPLLANPNAGVLYPVRPLLSKSAFPIAMRIFPTFHWAAAGIGALLLARSLGVSRAAAFLAAVTYAFSGVVVSQVFFPHVLPGTALLPWIVWTVARPFRRPGAKILVLALLLGLELLAGEPFSVALGIGCAVLWIVFEFPAGSVRRGLLELAAAVGLSIALALPQIVATLLWIPETARAVSGMRLSETLFYSVSPWRLLEFLIPYPFGPTWELDKTTVWGFPLYRLRSVGLFATLYAGPLAMLALGAVWKRTARGARFTRVTFLAALGLCVLPSLVPAAWEARQSPVSLRNPEKFAILFAFSLCLAVALEWDRIRGSRARAKAALGVGGSLAVMALAAAWAPRAAGRLIVAGIRGDPSLAKIAAQGLPAALAAAGLLWMLACVAIDLSARRRGAASWAAIAILASTVIFATRPVARTLSEAVVTSPPIFAKKIERRDPSGGDRVLGETFYLPRSFLEASQGPTDPAGTDYTRRNWIQHAPALWGRGVVFNQDFDSGDLSRVESLRRASVLYRELWRSKNFFGALALRWGIRYRDQAPLPGYHRFGGDGLQDWDEHEQSFPEIRLATRWREAATATAALQALPELAPGEIVLETGVSGTRQAAGGEVRVLERQPNRLRIESASTAPGCLFVLRPYWPYRSTLLDGRPVLTFPAQLAFTGILLPAGRHRIDWIEELPGKEVSRFGPLLFAIFGAVVFARAVPKGRHE
jgi:hypothetical protein